MAATGLKLSTALKTNPLGMPWCVGFEGACFIAIALLRWPLVYVLFGLGSLAGLLAYRKLAALKRRCT